MAINNIAPFHGIFHEHTVFYTKDNVQQLLSQEGFDTTDIQYYKNHSIIFKCKKHNRIPKGISNNVNYKNLFFRNYKETIELQTIILIWRII